MPHDHVPDCPTSTAAGEAGDAHAWPLLVARDVLLSELAGLTREPVCGARVLQPDLRLRGRDGERCSKCRFASASRVRARRRPRHDGS